MLSLQGHLHVVSENLAFHLEPIWVYIEKKAKYIFSLLPVQVEQILKRQFFNDAWQHLVSVKERLPLLQLLVMWFTQVHATPLASTLTCSKGNSRQLVLVQVERGWTCWLSNCILKTCFVHRI